jgi:hypothetical protein
MDVLSRRVDIFVDPDERRRNDVDASKSRAPGVFANADAAVSSGLASTR